MKRKVVTYLLLPLGLLVLAACSDPGSGGPGFPDPDPDPDPERTVLEAAGFNAPAHTGSLAGGEIDYFLIPPGSVTGDLIVIELDANLRLDLTSSSGAAVAITSSGPEYFQGTTATAFSTEVLDPSAIRPAPVDCRGSCIVLRNSGEELYFQVRGVQTSTPYSIFIYDDQYMDTEEPDNDTRSGAAAYVGVSIGGAIETVGDVDWWEVGTLDLDGEPVFFETSGEVDLDLEILHVRGTTESGPFAPGTVIQVQTGDFLIVQSASGLAARGGHSAYSLSPVTPAAVGNGQ